MRIEKKESKPLYGDFPLPSPLPCGDFWQRTKRQRVLSLQLLSIFGDKRKSAGEELRQRQLESCSQLCLKLVFSLQRCGHEGGQQRKRHFIEHDGGHQGSSKKTNKQTKSPRRGHEWSWNWLNSSSVSAERMSCNSSAVTCP